MLFDDLEPTKKLKKPKPLDDMSVAELKDYVTDLQAEIVRVETAITAKQTHMAAMDALFKKPDA